MTDPKLQELSALVIPTADQIERPGKSLEDGTSFESRLVQKIKNQCNNLATYQGVFEATKAVAETAGKPGGPVICGLSRTAHKDVDRAWEAIEGAARRRIHVFIATSETHMKHNPHQKPERVQPWQTR